MTALEKLRQAADGLTVKFFKEDGKLDMVWLCQDNRSEHVYVLCPQGDVTPDELAEKIREVIQEREIVRYVHVAEAWVATGKIGTPLEIPPGGVRDVPGRREAVLLTGEDNETGETFMQARFINPETRELGEAEEQPSGGASAEGRYVRMFEPVPQDGTIH